MKLCLDQIETSVGQRVTSDVTVILMRMWCRMKVYFDRVLQPGDGSKTGYMLKRASRVEQAGKNVLGSWNGRWRLWSHESSWTA